MRRTRASSSALSTPPTSGPSNNLCFIRLLAFVSVIGSQFHVLSSASSGPTTASMASATAAVVAAETIVSTTRTNLDAFNTTRAILTTDAQEVSTALFPFSFATKTQSNTNTQSPTFGSFTYSQSAALKNSKTSIKMHSNIESDSDSISGKGTSRATSASSKSNANILVGSLGPLSDSISTTASALKTARSTSKLSTDIATFSKNHWSAATAPYSLLSSSTSVPSASSSSVSFSDTERLRTFRRKHHHEHHWGPFFEEPLNSATSGDNLVSTAHLFTEAVLNCRVGMLKDKTVMWVRRTTEKVSLLTVGNVTYSGDPRIRVKFQYPNNWRLLINPTRKEDAGIYMCQVSTHPPRVFTTNLTILEPPLRLIDEQDREVGDRYYKSGSTVDLQCQISRNFLQKEKLNIFKSMQPHNVPKAHTNKFNAMESGPNELLLAISTNQTMLKLANQELEKQFTNFITWSKDEAVLPVSTVRRSSVTDKWLSSRISIPDARLSDSGNYSCSLGKLFTVIVQVQVLTGELPAAVQHNSASNRKPSSSVLQWICFIMPILFVVSQNISTSLSI